MDDEVTVDGRPIRKLPVTVSVTFIDDATFFREKGVFGFVAFWPATKGDAEFPAEQDCLTLEFALPQSAASRLLPAEVLPDLQVELSGFTSGKLGYEPGLGKFEWATEKNRQLAVSDCVILDRTESDDDSDESPRTEQAILTAIEEKLSSISETMSRWIPQLLYIGVGILIAVILLVLRHR